MLDGKVFFSLSLFFILVKRKPKHGPTVMFDGIIVFFSSLAASISLTMMLVTMVLPQDATVFY